MFYLLKGGCCVALKLIEVDDGNGRKAEIHRFGAATEEDIPFKDFQCGETVTLWFFISRNMLRIKISST